MFSLRKRKREIVKRKNPREGEKKKETERKQFLPHFLLFPKFRTDGFLPYLFLHFLKRKEKRFFSRRGLLNFSSYVVDCVFLPISFQSKLGIPMKKILFFFSLHVQRELVLSQVREVKETINPHAVNSLFQTFLALKCEMTFTQTPSPSPSVLPFSLFRMGEHFPPLLTRERRELPFTHFPPLSLFCPVDGDKRSHYLDALISPSSCWQQTKPLTSCPLSFLGQ